MIKKTLLKTLTSVGCKNTCGALCDLVPFVQFKKREKYQWRSVNFKPAALLKLTLPHGVCFIYVIRKEVFFPKIKAKIYDKKTWQKIEVVDFLNGKPVLPRNNASGNFFLIIGSL